MSKRFTDLKQGDFVLGLQDYNVKCIIYTVKDIEVKENEVYLTLENNFDHTILKFYGFGLDGEIYYNKTWLYCDYETYLLRLNKLESHLALSKWVGTLLKENNMGTIYINSINKRITFEEFDKLYYQEGHVYKINENHYQKCIKVGNKEDHSSFIIESLIIIINAEGHTQIIINPKEQRIPSLDFVNNVLSGKYTEIDPEVYEKVKSQLLLITTDLRQKLLS